MSKEDNQKLFCGTAFAGADCDPEFQEIARRFLCGDVASHGTLTDVQKALIRLTALVSCQTWKPLAQYTQAALDAGAAPLEILRDLLSRRVRTPGKGPCEGKSERRQFQTDAD